jgi:hypothetical protein
MSVNKRSLLLLLASFALLPSIAASKTVAVGPGCAFQTLHDALSSNPDVINLVAGSIRDSVVITHQTVVLSGGHRNCLDDSPVVASTTIVGDGASVIAVSGVSDVTIDHLIITGGTSNDGGGGINFSGSGKLTTSNTQINTNQASDGGGIKIGASATTELHLNSGTLISGNTASGSGGGVNIGRFTTLYMTDPETAITFNTAGVQGGGLSIDGDSASAEIGSIGYTDPATGAFFGAISNNQSPQGAGISLDNAARLRLFSTLSGTPVRVDNNGNLRTPNVPVTINGGGIFANRLSTVCGWGYSISGNKAASGAAIIGSNIDLFRDDTWNACGPVSAVSLGARDCKVGTFCNVVDENTGDQNGGGAGNAVIVVDGGFFNAERLEMSRTHQFGFTTLIDTTHSPTQLVNCLLTDNDVESVFAVVEGNATINGCTIADNNISFGFSPIFRAENSSFSLSDSIVWKNVGVALQNDSEKRPLPTITNVISDVADQFTVNTTNFGVLNADPLFVDASAGNYRLQRASPAVDYSGTGQPLDMDGHPRGINETNKPNGATFDIGAYELQDGIFANGFEPK